MILWLSVCCKVSTVAPEPSLIEKLEYYITDCKSFITKLLTYKIQTLTPENFYTYDSNKAIVKGLITEACVKYGNDVVSKYISQFHTLDYTLHSVIRKQYRTGNLRIHPDLMKREHICDILHSKTGQSFSAEF